MKVSELREYLQDDSSLKIMLPDGEMVPENFHVTEVGRVEKVFIDCGGTMRESRACVLQVWTANDHDHRLKSGKLDKIIEKADALLFGEDLSVEIEYGPNVAASYKLGKVLKKGADIIFMLDSKQTDCLAPDKCGVAGCC